MKIVFFSLFLFAITSANVEIQQALENGLHPFSEEMVKFINNANLTWKAKKHFTEKDLDHVKNKMGTILIGSEIAKNFNEDVDTESEIPKEFDGRKQWPECKEIIDDIRDQSNCGSCWAFAAVGSMSDRVCIASKGQQKVKISAEDLISCCTIWDSLSFCGFGCQGGMPSLAWGYWVKHGIVSGGNYNDTETCRPYEIPSCGHHTDKNPCKGMHRTPKCKKQCDNGADYKKDKHYGQKHYSVRNEVEAIQREIMTHGSVEASFQVMSDFPQYESGVYQATSHTLLGGHAVRILGWGEENNVPYWLVANSWNRNWGDCGYFKILRGKNHCQIESGITAGIPKI